VARRCGQHGPGSTRTPSAAQRHRPNTPETNMRLYRLVGYLHVMRIRLLVILARSGATCIVSQADSLGRGCGPLA